MDHKSKNIFDEVAVDYRTIHDQNLKSTGESSEYYAEYKILEIQSILEEPLIVLDVGCGDGVSRVYFKKYFKNIKYYGIDVSLNSLKVALSRNLHEFIFQLYNGESIPYRNNSVNCIYISCVLHHIHPEKRNVLIEECCRVLKPSGKLIIFEHNPLNPFTRKIVKDCVFDYDAVLLKAGNIRDLLCKVGFKKIYVNYTLFLPRMKFLKKFLFIEKWLKDIPFGGQYYAVATK